MQGPGKRKSALRVSNKAGALKKILNEGGFLGGSVVKNLPANAGDAGSIPGMGKSPGEGNGNPLQYSCLENSMDGRAWWATVHGITKRWTRLCDFHFTF